MIVLDIECSGPVVEKHGICEIAALDSDNPQNIFHEECRIDEDETCSLQALEVIGKTEADIRDKKRQTQKELLGQFLKWSKTVKVNICVCQHPLFDLDFIFQKARKYGIEHTLHYRSLDIHTIASYRYFQLHKKFILRKDYSGMDFTHVLEFCGLEDNRISMDQKTRKVLREGVPHNALSDARMTLECFSRLVYGKGLLDEFASKPIPEYLKN